MLLLLVSTLPKLICLRDVFSSFSSEREDFFLLFRKVEKFEIWPLIAGARTSGLLIIVKIIVESDFESRGEKMRPTWGSNPRPLD